MLQLLPKIEKLERGLIELKSVKTKQNLINELAEIKIIAKEIQQEADNIEILRHILSPEPNLFETEKGIPELYNAPPDISKSFKTNPLGKNIARDRAEVLKKWKKKKITKPAPIKQYVDPPRSPKFKIIKENF